MFQKGIKHICVFIPPVFPTGLLTQRCPGSCWACLTPHPGHICSPHHSTGEEDGGAQEVRRGHSQDSWGHGILLSTLSCEKKKAGQLFGVVTFVLPSQCYAWQDSAFLRMDEHLPAHGKQWMNSSFCLTCVHSFPFSLLNCLCLELWVFSL